MRLTHYLESIYTSINSIMSYIKEKNGKENNQKRI